MSKSYAKAAPLHACCGLRHYPTDECDFAARGARRCADAQCKTKTFSSRASFTKHLRDYHGVLESDVRAMYRWPNGKVGIS